MPAILHCPEPVVAERLGLLEQLQVVIAGRSGGALSEFAADFVDCDGCVVALVRINSHNDHGPYLPSIG